MVDILTNPNGSFISAVFDQVLVAGECGVAGHFRFQRNGNSCTMCQREAQAVEQFRRQAVEAVRALDRSGRLVTWDEVATLLETLQLQKEQE